MRPGHVVSVLVAMSLLVVAACSKTDNPVDPGTVSPGGSSGSSGSSVDDPTLPDGAPNPAFDGGSSSGGDAGPPSAGCGAPATGGYKTNQTISVGGQSRVYSIQIPSPYDPNKRYPVIFGFHGDGGDGSSARDAFKFESLEKNAIYVYPNGLNTTFDLDTWDPGKNKDVMLVDALAASIKKTYCVAEARFFLAGYSRGGFFANHVACMRGGVFRAAASHSGGGPYGPDSAYDGNGDLVCPGKPIAVIVLIGSNDGLLSDSTESRKYWTKRYKCSGTTAAAPSPCLASTGCTTPFKWCQIPGLGHQVWSSGPQAILGFFAAQ